MNLSTTRVNTHGQPALSGEVSANSAEDCLQLAIWTPATATTESKLPVIIFLTGGGYMTGGIDIPMQMPANWVHRSQKHIVVTTNYRLNIFGYPHARGLNGSTNYGNQDQRVAVEWVSENIWAFGGDASKITLWGQSAGSTSTDEYLFAWYENPLIQGAITTSGSSLEYLARPDDSGANFTFVAKSLGCNFTDAALELQCMRRLPMHRIEHFIGQYSDNGTSPALDFTRQIDNLFDYTNYTHRYLNNQVAKVPRMLSTAAREGASLVSAPLQNYTEGPSYDRLWNKTVSIVCAGYETCQNRLEHGMVTYRSQWAGNFSNISPVSWLGAYHSSDLYMLFGSYGVLSEASSAVEVETSHKMQDYLFHFINDPYSLPKYGWPQYRVNETHGGKLLRFGADGRAVQVVDGDEVDGACHIAGATYDTTP